jgi:uncharacterized membrane protein YhaH (DUF805 family)
MGLLNFLFGFDGRIGRRAYAFGTIGMLMISCLLLVIGAQLGGMSTMTFLFGLANMVCCTALGAKRLHDLNKSGWWLATSHLGTLISTGLLTAAPLLGIIGFLGIGIFELWLGSTKGEPGSNEFGPAPEVMRSILGGPRASTATADAAWLDRAIAMTGNKMGATTGRPGLSGTTPPRVSDPTDMTADTRVARIPKLVTSIAAPAGFGRRVR